MRLEHMMYKQGLQELSLSSMRKTVQGDVTPRPEEALWRCYRFFLELCNKRISGNGHKLQYEKFQLDESKIFHLKNGLALVQLGKMLGEPPALEILQIHLKSLSNQTEV